MAYMTKKLQHYVELSEKRPIPSSFDKFIKKHKKIENLILKKGNVCYCTCCGNEFISNIKVNDLTRCPTCRQKYLVKRFTLKNYETKKDLILLDKIDDDIWMLRVFELYSKYNYQFRNFDYSCTEYRRVFFDDIGYSEAVEGDNVFHTMGLSVVWHFKRRTCWKKKVWTWYYSHYGDSIGYICPHNIKQLLKGTKYQYCQLWKLVTKVDPFNLVDYFQRCLSTYYMTTELLVKYKLYNLALYSNRFGSTKKTFEERFGVSKELLSFMQKYNITYDELDVLRCCKVPNICLLRGLIGCSNLLWLSYRINLEKAWRCGLLSRENRNIYYDYLVSCEKLQYDFKDKMIVYPSAAELHTLHDKVVKLVEVAENEMNDSLIKKRAKELAKYTYKDKNFIISCFQDLSSIIDEASQMGNCIFRLYSESYALGKCNLFAVRNINNMGKSLISVETDINNTRIVQAEQSHHRELTDEQQDFLNKWLKHIKKKTVMSKV